MSHVHTLPVSVGLGRGSDSWPTGDRVCYLDRTSYRSALGYKAICFIGAIWRLTELQTIVFCFRRWFLLSVDVVNGKSDLQQFTDQGPNPGTYEYEAALPTARN